MAQWSQPCGAFSGLNVPNQYWTFAWVVGAAFSCHEFQTTLNYFLGISVKLTKLFRVSKQNVYYCLATMHEHSNTLNY